MAKATTMTVARLHKQLSAMVQNGQGWMKVSVDKSSFQHPLENEGTAILDVESVTQEWIPMSDGDGFIALRKDGTERGAMRLVLDGGYRESSNTGIKAAAEPKA